MLDPSEDPKNNFENYFRHLNRISLLGKIYKRFISSPILYSHARAFGTRLVEVGSGVGNGILGAYPTAVTGLDINPQAVEYCKNRGFDARLIDASDAYPIPGLSFDCCVLDNVLEHIQDPLKTLDECWRVTLPSGGLVVAVPGIRGFDSDSDHKVYYDEKRLRNLDVRWKITKLFAMPTYFQSQKLSQCIRQYCLVAVYRKL